VYEVDPGAFDDWSTLRAFLNEDPWRADVPLVSSVPVGALMLEPDTVYSYIDVIGILAGYVAGLLPGVGDGDLAFAIPDRDAVYAVHAATCSPGLANYLRLENHQNDARLLLNWPGGVDSHSLACVTNFVEMALDAASLVLDTTLLAETITVGAVRGRLEALALDTLDGADDPFRISPQAWGRTGTVMLSAIYEEAADRAAKEGLKALLRFAIRQNAKMFDVPGAAASVGKFATRLGGLSAVTPWEGVVIQVGDPWRDTGVSVSLSPSSATLAVNGTQSFTATVTGTANTSVTWSTTCGTVTGTGNTITYTAPTVVGVCTLTATSNADPSSSADALVTVEDGGRVGLVAHWTFDDCADLGRDATGNGFDGTLGGSAGCVSGPDGTALDLSTSSSFLEVAQDFTLPSSGFTTAFWVRIGQANTDFNYFLNGATTTRDNAFNFTWNPRTAAVEMLFGTQAGQPSTSTVNLVGEWHHLAFVNDAGTVTLFIDGVPFHTYAFSAQTTPVQHLVFGQDQDCFAGCFEADQALLGSLDDVRIYDVPLSAADVEALASAPGGGSGFDPAPSYITIDNVTLGGASGGTRRVGFDISWPESWRGPSRPSWVEASDNWDAAWVFVKYRVSGGAWQHATLAGSGHAAPAGSVVSVPSDRVGAFIHRSSSGYGTFTANGVGLQWDYVADGVSAGASVEVQPFAIEMVYLPEGSFSLGSGGTSTGEFREGGTTNAPFVVGSQSSVSFGHSTGQSIWTMGGWSGSPGGSTSTSFPTGYGAIYMMKHELTQGQYVDFLNSLTQVQADARRHTGSSIARYAITGSSVGSYETSLPYVAANYVSWADGAAFADWAGLRPITEFEFEKAARGPLDPVVSEYVWGSRSVTRVTGLQDAGTVNEVPTPADANANYSGGAVGPVRVGSFSAPGRSRRDAGAGYYCVLELSGNLYERPVTVGNVEGRAFTGMHGDGVLSASGEADVTLWPASSGIGTGFRGGHWNLTGGYLITSYRYKATFEDTERTKNDGWRGARSAP
jgi:hypothetical protein